MNSTIELFTIDCPACLVLEKKLKEKNIMFDKITDEKEFKKYGFTVFPMLKIGDKILNFPSANAWVNKQEIRG